MPDTIETIHWLQLAQKGDLSAFGNLVKHYQGSVCGYIAMFSVPRDIIEDVAQECFLTAFEKLKSFDESKSLGPWLRGIARNFVLRYREQEQKNSSFRKSVLEQLLSSKEPGETAQASLFSLRMPSLLNCLKKLPEKSAELIRKRYHENSNSKQIAKDLDTRPEAVRMSLVRVRLKLKECVEGKNRRNEL